ncbi:SurA N-terminal domain-containing protein [Desulfobulbus alkaliphilus]|uniref:SurA N-terminal domain-containing protein n=1 Tax=Desulfobulbus alkaliphilus TaxID=869814 RepID=UPI0019658BED|nr:SurA N-terminal domain-containing protein [Desulfobulbus alkaliphilus]MBM9537211.1 SurA N-terminal domain-containing protein [Desulfobulbus alkaliphilus]
MSPKTLLLFVFFLFPLPAFSLADVIDRSVAIVNNDIITLSEVNEIGAPFFQRIADETPPAQLEETLRQAQKEVIEQIIERKLLLQEAEKLNIRVSDAEIDTTLQRILTENRTSWDQFREDLSALGMNEKQYREELRQQILTSKLINQEIRAQIVIPEERVVLYYDRYYTEYENEGYYILQIGTLWGAPDRTGTIPTQTEAREKILNIRERAVRGNNFNQLAKQYSDLPSSVDGGDLGVFQRHEMATAMRQAVVNLKPGQISEIIELSNTYQIFKLLSSQTGQITAKVPYESVKEEIRDLLFQQEMETRFNEWLQNIRDKAYVRIL